MIVASGRIAEIQRSTLPKAESSRRPPSPSRRRGGVEPPATASTRARRLGTGVHLLQDDVQAVLLIGGDAVGQHRDDRVALGLAAGGQPLCNRGEVVEHLRGAVGQRWAGERLDERTKAVQVLAGARVHPALHRVGCERQDDGVDGLFGGLVLSRER